MSNMPITGPIRSSGSDDSTGAHGPAEPDRFVQPTSPVNRVSPERLIGIVGDWSASGHGNLARRLAHALRGAITGGVLAGGTRLPPERTLATLLTVSRSTVTAALDELRAEGLLTSRQGRGTEVVGPVGGGSTGDRVGAHFVNRGSGIDLAAVVPTDGSHLPPLTLRTEDLLAGRGQLEPHGLPALREALARRHSRDGRPTESTDIQVTHGAHHAIALAIAAFVAPGTSVAVEDPSYPGMLDLLDLHKARPIPLTGDSGGPDPDALAAVLRRDRPSVVYLQTGVHNPTGRVIGPARRRALAAVLDDHGDAVVVEDDTLADLVFTGKVRPGFAELCRLAPVVTVGSLSKVAWAALRIGWLRATGVVGERIGRVRVTTDLGASVPSQLLALQLLPDLEDLAERRRLTLEVSVRSAVGFVHEHLPEWELREPDGSSALWPRLPITDASSFVALARRHGVHVTPGAAHSVTGGPDPHLRLCVDRPANQVAEGLDRLVAAWHDATCRAVI